MFPGRTLRRSFCPKRSRRPKSAGVGERGRSPEDCSSALSKCVTIETKDMAFDDQAMIRSRTESPGTRILRLFLE